MNHCLACDGAELSEVLDLGHQPPANLLLDTPDQPFPTYPLQLFRCTRCGHGQLGYSVDPRELFLNYKYSSGVSRTMREYFAWFADALSQTLPKEHKILEIACNDGSLMSEIRKCGFEVTGVEPDPHLAQVAREKSNSEVINQFWPVNIQSIGSYSVVIALNVLAHTPDPLRFLRAISLTLGEGGLALVQVSQGDMLREYSFDTIYHEHLSYFTPYSMAVLAERAGLVVQRALRVNILSGSDLYILRRAKEIPISRLSGLGSSPFFVDFVTEPPENMAQRYSKFAQESRLIIQDISNTVLGAKQQGLQVAFVGAAAKASVVLHSIDSLPNFVMDEAPLKIGRWIPNTGLQIKPFEALADIDGSLLCVISAWNLCEEISAKIRAIRGPTRIYTYFP